MPARSKAQQKAADAALAFKRGQASRDELKGSSREMAESMTEKDLAELARTEHEDLPDKVGER